MKKKFLNLLCCPNTHKDLTLVDPIIQNDDIISGFLVAGNFKYCIRDGIPRFIDNKNYSKNFDWQWNKWSRTQFEKENFGKPMEGYTRNMFEKITELSNSKIKGKIVLDIGCGAGRFIDIVLDKGGIPVAIDNSNAIDTAKKNFANYSDEILFIQADALKLPFKNETIDFAYSIGVLHHTPSPETGIEEASRVIRHGGELAVSVYSKKGYYTFPTVNLWRKFFQLLHPILGYYPALIYSNFFGFINFLLAKIYKPFSYPTRIFFPTVCLPDLKWSILDTFDSITPSYQSGHSLYEVSKWFLNSKFSNLRIAAWENIIGKK
jgi:ubiquinone/menaquinone biosynthesis C-methylase UbiE/uncharacterized protein YbaR (Trm112 family)